MTRDGKMGSTRRVDPSNPPKITGWVNIFNPPKIFNPPNPRALAGLGGLARRAKVISFFLFLFLGTSVLFKKVFRFLL